MRGAGSSPFVSGIIAGRLDRGEPDQRPQEVLLRSHPTTVETLFVSVGSGQNRCVGLGSALER